MKMSRKAPLCALFVSTALCVLAWVSASSSPVEVHPHLSRDEELEEECLVGQTCMGDAGKEEEYDNGEEEYYENQEEVNEEGDRTHQRGGPTSTHSGNIKQQHNHTARDREATGVKQATKGTDTADDEQLLQWLSDFVPDATACSVYLAPSTIPGAGLGMFAGQAFKPRDVVTQGDIVIPLSELDWHNGFELNFFLWEEYTWSSSSFIGMDEVRQAYLKYV
jgi:hypothetical protein